MDFFFPQNGERYTVSALKGKGVIKNENFLDYAQLRKLGYFPITYNKPDFNPVFFNIIPTNLVLSSDGTKYVQEFMLQQRDVDTVKAGLKAAITALRWEKETAGISFGNNTILTGIADQNRIATICLSAVSSKVKGTDFTPVQFKTAAGEWVTLDADTLIAIGEAVTAYVEACFANEQRLHDLVDSATTFEALQAIDINAGWA